MITDSATAADIVLQKFEYGVKYHEIEKSLNSNAVAEALLGLDDDDDGENDEARQDDANPNNDIGQTSGTGKGCLVTFPPTVLSSNSMKSSASTSNTTITTEQSEPFFFGIDCRTEDEKKLGTANMM